jgi:hypothetical protein
MKLKFLVVFLLSFLEVLSCYAQESTSIIGKWKVFAVMSDDFYHHFDKDSTVLSNMFKEKLSESKKDTKEAIKLVKTSIQIFENSFNIFKSDSTYQNIIGNTSFEEGKFTIDFAKKQIFTSAIGSSGVKQEQMYHFNLDRDKLELTMASDNDDVTFYLEKL